MRLAILLCLLNVAVSAQVIFVDDFEARDTSAWSDGLAQTANGSAAVTAALPHSGLWSFQCTIAAASGTRTELVRNNISAVQEIYLRTYFYVDPGWTQTSSTWVQILQVLNSGAWSGQGIYLYNNAGNLKISSSAPDTISKGVWHSLLVHVKSGSGNGIVESWVDDIQEYASTTANIHADLNAVRLGIESSDATMHGTVTFDDFVVSTSTIASPAASITVRHPNTAARSAMPVDVTLYGQVTSDVLVASVDSAPVYTKTGSMTGHERIPIVLETLSAGDHTLDVYLRDSGGTAKARYSGTFHKYLAGTSVVSIDGDNNLVYDGVKGFLVTPFEVDHYDPDWIKLHSPGYVNAHGWMAGYNTSYTKNTYKTYAESMGVRVIGPNGRASYTSGYSGLWANDPNAARVAGDYASYLKDNASIAMWTWGDEPDIGVEPGNIPAATVRTLTTVTHNNDPNHPVITNLYGWTPSTTRKRGYTYPIIPDNTIGMVSDVFGWDMYPIIYQGGPNNGTISSWIDTMEAWKRYNYDLTPWIPFVESGIQTGGSATMKGPTPAQLRMEAWLAVVHGMKGVSWWGPDAFTTLSPQHRAEQARFVKDIAELKDVILTAAPSRVVVDSANVPKNRVDTMIREDGKSIYVFAVRLSDIGADTDPPIGVQFTVTGVGDSIAAVLLGEGRTVQVAGGVFSDSFAPCAVHVYQISKLPLPQPPTGLQVTVR